MKIRWKKRVSTLVASAVLLSLLPFSSNAASPQPEQLGSPIIRGGSQESYDSTNSSESQIAGKTTNSTKALALAGGRKQSDSTEPSTVSTAASGENTVSTAASGGNKLQASNAVKVVKELTDKRTRNSRTFLNSDGTTTVQTSVYSMNYFDGQMWQEIDTTIHEDQIDANYTHSMMANNFHVKLNDKGSKQSVTFSVNDQFVTYLAQDMNNVTGIVYGNTINYPNAWQSTDLQYQIQNDQLKMQLHLADNQAPKTFQFELKTNGVQPRTNADGSIDFVDMDGKLSFKIPPMWVQDASNDVKRYDKLNVDVKQKGNKSVIVMTLDDTGLLYPIVIDPTTTLNDGLENINLLANPDFENYSGTNGIADSWDLGAWSGTYSFQVVTSPVSNGTHAQRVTASGLPNNHFIAISQMIKVDPNKPYNVSGRFFVESLNNAKVQLYLDFYSASFTYTGGADVVDLPATTGGGFVTVSSSGIVPANTSYVRIYALIRATADNGGGTFDVDSMNFQYSITPNLLSNADFESNLANGSIADSWINWYTTGTSNDIQVVTGIDNSPNRLKYIYSSSNGLISRSFLRDGTRFYTLTKNDNNGNRVKSIGVSGTATINPIYSGIRSQKLASFWIPNNGASSIMQTLVVIPSKSFVITGNFNIEMLYHAKIQMYVDFFSSTGQYLGSNITESYTTNGRFSTLSSLGIVPANALFANVNLLIRATADDAVGTFYVDALSFKYRYYLGTPIS